MVRAGKLGLSTDCADRDDGPTINALHAVWAEDEDGPGYHKRFIDALQDMLAAIPATNTGKRGGATGTPFRADSDEDDFSDDGGEDGDDGDGSGARQNGSAGTGRRGRGAGSTHRHRRRRRTGSRTVRRGG